MSDITLESNTADTFSLTSTQTAIPKVVSQLSPVLALAGKTFIAIVLTAQLAAMPVHNSATDAIRLNTPLEAVPILWADGSGILWADGSRMVY